MSDVRMTYEWFVTVDGDPSSTTVYRGPDENQARQVFGDVPVISGWGAQLRKQLVGPVELVEVRK